MFSKKEHTTAALYLEIMLRRIICGVVVIMGTLLSISGVSASEVQSDLLELDFAEDHVQTLEFSSGIQALSIEHLEGVSYRVWNGAWTEWSELAYEEPGLDWSSLTYLDRTQVLQIKSESRDDLKVFVLQFEPRSELMASRERLIAQSSGSFRVISREEWGADEVLGTYNPNDIDDDDAGKDPVDICAPLTRAYPGQYQTQRRVDYADRNGRNLIWPREYSRSVKKIVIHHTAQEMKDLNEDGMINMVDYRLSVQAIYRFHTVSRGWGDLGYHYLVDPFGNVYEGRSGGKNVIGGHVLCQNSNTIGVSLMGNFDDIRVPRQQYDGLVKITKQLVDEYKINPKGKSAFRGEILPHIVTHAEIGDVTASLVGRGATACPGRHMKNMMTRLRTAVSGEILVDTGTSYGFAASNIPRVMNAEPLMEVTEQVTLTNTGSASWNTVEVLGNDGEVYADLSGVLVSPGQSVQVPIRYQAGFEGGRQRVSMQVRANNTEFMEGAFIMNFVVPRPRYRYEVMSESEIQRVLVGQSVSATLQVKNTSNFPWLTTGEYQVVLKPITRRRERVIVDSVLPTIPFPETVLPGETAVVSVELPAQRRRGEMAFEYLPVMGPEKGFQGDPLILTLEVDNPVFAAEIDTVERRVRLQRGRKQMVAFSVTNTSNFDWEPGMVWIDFIDSEREDILNEVKKNESVNVVVPVRPQYSERNVKVEGRIGLESLPSYLSAQRFRQKTLRFSETLSASGRPQLIFEKVGQSTETLPRARGEYEEYVEYLNAGNVPWYQHGEDAVTLQLKDKGDFIHRSWRGRKIAGLLIQEMVMPGEIGTFVLTLDVRRLPRNSVSDIFEPVIEGQRVKVKKGYGEFVVPGRNEISQRSTATVRNEKRGEVVEKAQHSTFNIQNDENKDVVQYDDLGVEQVPPMRVWLSEFDQDVVEISSTGKFVVTRNDTYDEYQSGEIFRIQQKELDGGGVVRVQTLDRPALEVVNWDRSKTFGSTTYYDNFFRNIIEVRVVDGKLTLINELSLEDYMKGIAEVPESNDQPDEKRKVIAVLARSYALHYLISDYKKFPGKPYNAADSPAIFQKYLGYGFELRSPKWQQAVSDTDKEVIVASGSFENLPFEQRVLRAAYFSCTDGPRTSSWDEVWSDNDYFQRFGAVFQSVWDPLGDDPDRSGFQACGHQVGLSGYGATQKARQGEDYQRIIGSYYRSVDFELYE